ncbi:MAG: hypothetical protein QNM02_21405 [Acidimicrobiia bacterium]|nr:hypothetical protein [Acidimicrobiia bacterium]
MPPVFEIATFGYVSNWTGCEMETSTSPLTTGRPIATVWACR